MFKKYLDCIFNSGDSEKICHIIDIGVPENYKRVEEERLDEINKFEREVLRRKRSGIVNNVEDCFDNYIRSLINDNPVTCNAIVLSDWRMDKLCDELVYCPEFMDCGITSLYRFDGEVNLDKVCHIDGKCYHEFTETCEIGYVRLSLEKPHVFLSEYIEIKLRIYVDAVTRI